MLTCTYERTNTCAYRSIHIRVHVRVMLRTHINRQIEINERMLINTCVFTYAMYLSTLPTCASVYPTYFRTFVRYALLHLTYLRTLRTCVRTAPCLRTYRTVLTYVRRYATCPRTCVFSQAHLRTHLRTFVQTSVSVCVHTRKNTGTRPWMYVPMCVLRLGRTHKHTKVRTQAV